MLCGRNQKERSSNVRVDTRRCVAQKLGPAARVIASLVPFCLNARSSSSSSSCCRVCALCGPEFKIMGLYITANPTQPARPISLTLTQTPLPQLTAWSQFIAAALGHTVPFGLILCASLVRFCLGQPDPTRPISLTLTQTPQPQLTAWSQFIAGAWS